MRLKNRTMDQHSTTQRLEETQSLPEAFFSSLKQRTLANMLRQAGRTDLNEIFWSSVTPERASHLVRSVATYLRENGVTSGSKVGIISATRVEWSIADLAILTAGGVTVSIYPSSTWSEMKHILDDAGVTALFIENREQLDKLYEVARQGGHAELSHRAFPIISFESADIPQEVALWKDVTSTSAASCEELSSLWGKRSTLASLVYTSGTTGTPKGVMQSHGNHLTNVRQALESGVFEERGSFFLFLPLAHSFARLMHYVGMLTDTTLSFPSIPDPLSSKLQLATVAQDLSAANPSYLPAVPRLFEKIRDSLKSKATSKGLANFLLQKCLNASLEFYEASIEKRASTISTQLWYYATEPIRKGIKKRIFGGEFRYAISGGAKLPLEINRFFDALGIVILEGYGLTETCVATHVNLPHKRKVGSVGPAFPDVEVVISDTGEVLIKGPNVSSGYYNLPEATAEAWDENGWFHTGDIGSIDEEGFLSITGRIKELIVTAGGKKIAPVATEGHLQQAPAVSHILMFGEGKPYLIGLVTLLFEEVRERLIITYPELKPLSQEDFSRSPIVKQYVWEQLEPLNQNLPSFEQVKKILILPEDFTLENELLTPTQKPRRKLIFSRFQKEIEALYSAPRE
jgi:long-chain acyl-CoA synthetase